MAIWLVFLLSVLLDCNADEPHHLVKRGAAPSNCTYSGYCKNGGTCNPSSGYTSYTCTCAPGWTGQNCQYADCSYSGYCVNGGTCSLSNGGSSYICNCTDGWKDNNCQKRDCVTGSYCNNGASCSEVASGYDYQCTCTSGWKGRNCHLIDCATGNYCANGGTCSDVSNGYDYQCACTSGWKGRNCHLRDCATGSYCNNGGTCSELFNGYDYHCACTNGWKGRTCHLRDCATGSYCNNGGTCSEVSNGYNYLCTCTSGWKGLNCKHRDCATGNYCYHGGTCSEVSNGYDYLCACNEGWEGRNCQLIDCESPIRCLHDSKCNLKEGGKNYTCDCSYGWAGDNCQDIDVCTPYKDADIVFLVDISGSAGTAHVNTLKTYIENFISKFPIGPDHFQFALLTFAFEPHVLFYLNSHTDNSSLLQAVEDAMGSITFEGPTMVDKALNFVASKIFVEGNGARKEVGRYVFVLTDGLFANPLQSRKNAHALHIRTNADIYSIAAGRFVKPQGLLDISSTYRHVYPIGMQDSVQTVLKQTMFGCEGCTRRVSDITLMFDIESDTSFEDFDTLLKAGELVINNAHMSENNSDISIATFGGEYESLVRFQENKTKEELIQVLSTAVGQTSGNKHLNGSYLVHKAMEGFSSSNKRNVIIFFTQAVNLHVDSDEIKNIVDGKNILMASIGSGLNTHYDRLLKLSSHSSLTYILGNDLFTDETVLFSLQSVLEYDECIV
ncbi:transmembrane matrix receptor MUP-4-like isoform X2 [Mya arenaria]|uniref:transmembrane matrix receptor MUP-4-like isoform X2 n=1 Tax=Mya arenaria TaxID=6604 RepID=UPI0022E8224A|nr:transmembrane matrix receptor MUP-4-like isoform X2 [Mya arenaria]